MEEIELNTTENNTNTTITLPLALSRENILKTKHADSNSNKGSPTKSQLSKRSKQVSPALANSQITIDDLSH